MNAPKNEAQKLDINELPPTAAATHSDGIIPSSPTRPRRNPAISTPKSNNGSICLANVHDELNHSPVSPLSVLVNVDNPIVPAANANNGMDGNANARIITGIAVARTFHSLTSNHLTKMAPNVTAKNEVIGHFHIYRRFQMPFGSSDLPQLAKTSMATIDAK